MRDESRFLCRCEHSSIRELQEPGSSYASLHIISLLAAWNNTIASHNCQLHARKRSTPRAPKCLEHMLAQGCSLTKNLVHTPVGCCLSQTDRPPNQINTLHPVPTTPNLHLFFSWNTQQFYNSERLSFDQRASSLPISFAPTFLLSNVVDNPRSAKPRCCFRVSNTQPSHQ